MKLSKWEIIKKATKDELNYQKIMFGQRIKPIVEFVSRPWFIPLTYIYIYYKYPLDLLNILIFIFIIDIIIDIVRYYARRKEKENIQVLESNSMDNKETEWY